MVWDLADLFKAKKKLPGAPKWVEKDSDCVSIISSLEIDGVVIEAIAGSGNLNNLDKWKFCLNAA